MEAGCLITPIDIVEDLFVFWWNYQTVGISSFPNGQANVRYRFGTKKCLAILVRFVHQGCACKGNFHFLLSNQKRGKYRWRRKTFRMLSAGPLQLAPRKPCFWPITGVVNDIYEGIWLEYLLQAQACIFRKASLKYPHTRFHALVFE